MLTCIKLFTEWLSRYKSGQKQMTLSPKVANMSTKYFKQYIRPLQRASHSVLLLESTWGSVSSDWGPEMSVSRLHALSLENREFKKDVLYVLHADIYAEFQWSFSYIEQFGWKYLYANSSCVQHLKMMHITCARQELWFQIKPFYHKAMVPNLPVSSNLQGVPHSTMH